jgi:hypothetical protein
MYTHATTTMVKESFCAGNKQVSRRDLAGNLMRGYLVDKLQEIVISDWIRQMLIGLCVSWLWLPKASDFFSDEEKADSCLGIGGRETTTAMGYGVA